MDSPPENPPTNKLGPGIGEKDLLEAIKRSGYPLQTIVANQLRKDFAVQEEWSYIDNDTGEQRTIDLHAGKTLFNRNEDHPRVRPRLDLLIECKQSSLPYVFFLSEAKPWLPHFPSLAGLVKDELKLTTDDSPSNWRLPVLSALGLSNHPFLTSPPYSSTFSKCVRKGAELELSGSDSYNGLIYPLLKSVLHFQVAERPPKTAVYFDAHLVVGIGVLDAPMIGVTVDGTAISVTPIPWVRVTRHESMEGEHSSERSKLRAVDVVHKDFVAEYLTKSVGPFAEEFGRLALKHQLAIADGAGFASGLEKDPWNDIEARLKPDSLSAGMERLKSVGRQLLKKGSTTDEEER